MSFKLTHDQKCIADVLEITGFLKIAQAHKLLEMRSAEKDFAYAKKVLSQLQHINRALWCADEIVTLPHLRKKDIDFDMLSAVDIMLELLEVPALAISTDKPPFKLSFLAERGEDIVPFAVAVVAPGTETELNHHLSFAGRELTAIFLLSDISQRELLTSSLTHFFAIRDGERLCYFKGG